MSGVEIQQYVRPGDVIAGKYKIDHVLGQGGMGVVVAAHHLQLDERVAIKFLLGDAVKRPELVQRFEREARAAVKIKSEHVARVIDVGVLDTGAPYMVMEYLDGVDLAARVHNEGPVPWQQAADFILQACEAIVEAHALGIIHRDLKPANLFVLRRADGLLSIKVLDFGISKSTALSGSGGSDMTQTQSMLGSPFYMSPEQMQSARSVDMRADIYALGVILYQIMMGRVPFEAETLPELVLKIVQEPAPPMRITRPDIPTQLEAVVMRCLEKDRDRRYQHIGELATALLPFAPERSRSSAERILRVVQTSGLDSPNHRPSERNLSSSRQKNATQVVAPVSVPLASSSGSQGAALQDSRHGGGTLHHPHSTGPQAPVGPPLGTLPPGVTPAFGVTSSSQSWQQTAPQVPKNNPLIVVGAVAAFLLVAGGIGFGVHRVVSSRTPPIPSVSVSVTVPVLSPAPEPAPEPEPVPEPVPVPTLDASVAVVEDAGATPATSVPVVPKPPPGPVVAAPAPMPGPAPVVKPNCKTPYVIDSNGIKKFKEECL
ncbi:MAG: protein kinase [Labilithrix sp.]|nr:protein kinase [Labilithrix sp.]MCW5816574.1 protein kinase [Labilithrix sp.]